LKGQTRRSCVGVKCGLVAHQFQQKQQQQKQQQCSFRKPRDRHRTSEK